VGTLALLCGSAPGDASAYSYAAAGAEPVIDAREATLAALESGDVEAARKLSEAAQSELTYLDEHFGTQLRAELQTALAGRDPKAIDRAYLRAFATELRRRISAAAQNLQDYQQAKILVVRSKRFLDLLAPHLPAESRARAQQALAACLAAVGNPGVFGVGATQADPDAFARNAAVVLASVESL
jgi:hypothetical protein